tara:strand:- start:2475 stop:2735 length:261 start_codon:yes stop_codon:yes gene_type:complete
MEQLLKTLSKLVRVATLVVILLIIFGSIFTQHVRSNLVNLLNSLTDMGIIGFVVAFSLLYLMRDTPKDIYKLIKAKGFNKKFWDTL